MTALRTWAVGCLALVAFSVSAQSTLPPTPPTSAPAVQITTSSSGPRAADVRSAVVTWQANQLQVRADNARLDSLLREIAAKANLTITGGVPDERIFGNYGPGSVDDVLSELLDGLPINMLLVDHSGAKPKELVLTSRTGTASLPSPQIQQADTQNVAAPSSEPYPAQGQRPEVSIAGQPANSGGAPGQIGLPGPAAAGTADPNQPVSPNGVKTPQQIFEQLQRLRQQGGGAAPQ